MPSLPRSIKKRASLALLGALALLLCFPIKRMLDVIAVQNAVARELATMNIPLSILLAAGLGFSSLLAGTNEPKAANTIIETVDMRSPSESTFLLLRRTYHASPLAGLPEEWSWFVTYAVPRPKEMPRNGYHWEMSTFQVHENGDVNCIGADRT